MATTTKASENFRRRNNSFFLLFFFFFPYFWDHHHLMKLSWKVFRRRPRWRGFLVKVLLAVRAVKDCNNIKLRETQHIDCNADCAIGIYGAERGIFGI